jgi:hypothetical protein
MRKAPATKPLDVLTRLTTTAGKQIWKKIGVAFPIKDGTGFSLRLDYLPRGFDENLQMIVLPQLPKQS